MDDDDAPWATQPPYVEAWPRIDFRSAVANAMAGRDLCVFEMEMPDGEPYRVGEAFIDGEGGGRSLRLDFYVSDFAYLAYANGEQHLALDLTENLADKGRVRFYPRCPICNGRRSVLVLRQRWGCATCHQLRNRSTFLDSIARAFEERDGLTASVRRGRQRHQRNAEFGAMVQRLAALTGQLEGVVRPFVPPIYMQRVVTRYVSASDDRTYQARKTHWPDGDATGD